MRPSNKTALALTAALALSLGLTACGGDDAPGSASDPNGASPSDQTGDPVRMCVLVADATSSEALGFRAYYEEYVAQNFNVTFQYSDVLEDADGERAAMETFIGNNCQAILSMASADRAAQIEMAASAGIHYAVVTGTLTEAQHEEYKNEEYFVGAIGPGLAVERQAGYDMVRHFVDELGFTRFAIFGGAIPYFTEMHIHRAAGMLAALAEDPTTTYGGEKDFEAILGKIMSDGTIRIADFESERFELTGYQEMWNFSDATWQANLANIVATRPDAVLAVGTGVAVFGAAVDGTDVVIGDIDAYTPENLAAMEDGKLAYLAGKFTSSIGPIFAATKSAVVGSPIRAEGDTAFALDQGYWVATDAEQFQRFLDTDTIEHPVYNTENLSPFIGTGAAFEDFAQFVSQYSFDDLVG